MAKTVIFPDKTDVEIAHMVRMLMNNDIHHEAVITAACDRILRLVDENKRLRELIASGDEHEEDCDYRNLSGNLICNCVKTPNKTDDELKDCVGEGC